MKSILDPSFHYVPSTQTDLRKTFSRIRREMAKAKVQPPPRRPLARRAVRAQQRSTRAASDLPRPGGYNRPVGATRQIALPTSSATSSAPARSTATPTGRPRAHRRSRPGTRVTTSSGSPAGRPLAKGTNTTL